MMSSSYINESVFTTNLKILKKQNETKELFFRCLDEERTYEYFKKELEKIWDNIDYSFLQKQLEKYEEIIHEQNIEGKQITEIEPSENGLEVLFALVPLTVILKQEERLKRYKLSDYKKALESYAYKTDKRDYLKTKVNKYTDNIVEYVSHTGGKSRYVGLNSYASMIQNTNMTRTAWNRTMKDADMLGIEKFYIPYHSFSCSDCIEHQNIIYTKEQILRIVDDVNEAEETGSQSGDILHPNCKCILVMLNNGENIVITNNLTDEEKVEISEIRQKVNSLTLEKERLLTDKRIQKELSNQDEVDKINQKLMKINSSIKEEQEKLPTEELRKQVVAINR